MSVNHRGIILFALITLTFSPLCLADGNDRDAQPGFGQVISQTLEVVLETVRGLFVSTEGDDSPDMNGCEDPGGEQCLAIDPFG